MTSTALLAYRSLTILCLLFGRHTDTDDDLVIRFAPNCFVGGAISFNDAVLLRITCPNGPATAAWLKRDQLCHWRNAIDLWNVCDISRTLSGEVILLVAFPDPADKCKIGYNCFVFPPNEPSKMRRTSRFTAAIAEGQPLFLGSRPDLLLTTKCIYSTNKRLEPVKLSHSVNPSIASLLGDKIVAAIIKSDSKYVEKSAERIVMCDLSTGKGQPIRLKSRSKQLSGKSSTMLDSDLESMRVVRIISVPGSVDRFILELVSVDRRATILEVNLAGAYDVLLQGDRRITGLGYDKTGTLHIMNKNGVSRLDANGSWKFVAVPEYHECGGFMIAENIPGFVIVLSSHSASLPYLDSAQKKALMVDK